MPRGKPVNKIALLDTLADVSAALAIMEEIKRLQRAEAWTIALDRYSALRRHLAQVERLHGWLALEQRERIVRAIEQFRIIEAQVEKALTSGAANPNLVQVNLAVSQQIDAVQNVMIAIRQAGS